MEHFTNDLIQNGTRMMNTPDMRQLMQQALALEISFDEWYLLFLTEMHAHPEKAKPIQLLMGLGVDIRKVLAGMWGGLKAKSVQ